MESQVRADRSTEERADFIRDPYPYFAAKRAEAGVFRGTVMDYSKTPENMRPKQTYAAMSFDAVNTVFRDGKLFNSAMYDATIGLFIGPTILAMGGTTHREHRNLVSAAFKSKSLVRWEPEIVRPIVNALIDEFVDSGETDLIKQFTFEFPTRVIAKLLGLPEEDLPMFRKWAVDLISYTVRYKQAFESSAALKDYFLVQMDKRKSHPTEDIIGDLVTAEIDGERAHRRGHLLLSAPAASRGPGDHLPVVGQPALPVAHASRSVRGRAGRPRSHRPRHRGGVAIRDAADHGAAVHRPRTPNSTASRSRQQSVVDVCMGSANRDENAVGTSRSSSTSSASARRTSPSRQANTRVSACIWRGWRPGSPSSAFSPG